MKGMRHPMRWNADLYQEKHNFVAEYGKALLEHIPDSKQLSILDLGCGTGDLTYELSKKSSHVIGIDNSYDMIEKARSRHPEIKFQIKDACNLEWVNQFDIIFSNAVFHWILDQTSLLREIYQALKNEGRLICEFGAKGNISSFQKAFETALGKRGYTFNMNFYLPSVEEYKELLEGAGFRVETIFDYERPTPLQGEESGLRNWVTQFFAKDLNNLKDIEQEQIFTEMENTLKPNLWDGSRWIADYRRLRVIVTKP